MEEQMSTPSELGPKRIDLWANPEVAIQELKEAMPCSRNPATTDEHLAGIWRPQLAGQQSQCRRLACAIWTEKAKALALLDTQRDATDCPHRLSAFRTCRVRMLQVAAHDGIASRARRFFLLQESKPDALRLAHDILVAERAFLLIGGFVISAHARKRALMATLRGDTPLSPQQPEGQQQGRERREKKWQRCGTSKIVSHHCWG
mmetsp:Transcript_139318/g.445460  ORF Transcript_139318/g.445460 Transcript_139318/m.445460 type:complete len:204 (+) Transcript_139318:751-1362(+)